MAGRACYCLARGQTLVVVFVSAPVKGIHAITGSLMSSLFGCLRAALAGLLIAIVGGVFFTSAAATSRTDGPRLLQAWLAYPDLASVDWPYAYIREIDAADTARRIKRDLLGELDNLSWRLEEMGYVRPVETVAAWRRRIESLQAFRLPGDWGAAQLLAQPEHNVPLSRISAIGSCQPPNWVEVWDVQGIRRLDWPSARSLGDLVDDDVISATGDGQVAVVTPMGHVVHRGIQAWNYTDMDLMPGSRVIVALPFKGDAFPWIRDAIARLTARTPTGTECRESEFRQDSARHE